MPILFSVVSCWFILSYDNLFLFDAKNAKLISVLPSAVCKHLTLWFALAFFFLFFFEEWFALAFTRLSGSAFYLCLLGLWFSCVNCFFLKYSEVSADEQEWEWIWVLVSGKPQRKKRLMTKEMWLPSDLPKDAQPIHCLEYNWPA